MILSDKKIVELQKGSPPLIQEAPDFELQLQPSGFDISVKEVHEFLGRGTIDFSNEERSLPETRKLEFKEGWIDLKPGSYKVKTNEVVNIPKDVVAFAQTRSSLLRMGAFTVHAFWDAGFHGRSEFLLVVENPQGLKLKENARIAQLLFIKLREKPDQVYYGIYKGMK